MHFKKLCRECGEVVAQCRCLATNKKVEFVNASECPNCSGAKTADEAAAVGAVTGTVGGAEDDWKTAALEQLGAKCSPAEHVWRGSLEGDGRYMRAVEPKADAPCLCGDYVFGDVQTGKVRGSVYAALEVDMTQPPPASPGAAEDKPEDKFAGVDFGQREQVIARARAFIDRVMSFHATSSTLDAYEDVVVEAFVDAYLFGYQERGKQIEGTIYTWTKACDELQVAFRNSMDFPLMSPGGIKALTELHIAEKAATKARKAVRALVP